MPATQWRPVPREDAAGLDLAQNTGEAARVIELVMGDCDCRELFDAEIGKLSAGLGIGRPRVDQ